VSKKYQTSEYKEKNASRMATTYNTEQGRAYEHKRRRTASSRYVRGRYNAKRRNKVFTLTLEEYAVLVALPCTYCGKSIADETGVGLDRINNERGYVAENVNPCCASCNRIRHRSMGAEEFKRQTKINRGIS